MWPVSQARSRCYGGCRSSVPWTLTGDCNARCMVCIRAFFRQGRGGELRVGRHPCQNDTMWTLILYLVPCFRCSRSAAVQAVKRLSRERDAPAPLHSVCLREIGRTGSALHTAWHMHFVNDASIGYPGCAPRFCTTVAT